MSVEDALLNNGHKAGLLSAGFTFCHKKMQLTPRQLCGGGVHFTLSTAGGEP